jgi:hypothetical protein
MTYMIILIKLICRNKIAFTGADGPIAFSFFLDVMWSSLSFLSEEKHTKLVFSSLQFAAPA